MKNLKRLIGIAIAVGLTLVVFGCGGSSYLTEMPGELSSEDTYPVSIRVGASSQSSFAEASKDAGGIGISGLGAGDVGAPADWYRIIPYITWAATTTGGAPTYPICATQAECDAGGYPAYLVCNGAWTDDIAKERYIGVCSGQLPEAAKTHTVDGVVHYYNYIRTTQNDGTKAVVRLDGDWSEWADIEASIADMLLDGNQWNIAYQTFDPGGDLAGLDLQGCDGQVNAVGNTPMSIGLDGNNVPIDEFDETLGAPIDAVNVKDFVKGVKIETTMGDNILDSEGITAHRCHFEQSFDFSKSLAALPETVDMSSGDFRVCGLYCNDLAVNCDVGYCDSGVMNSSLIAMAGGNQINLSNGATDVFSSLMGVSFETEMAGAISPYSISYQVVNAPATYTESMYAYNVQVHPLDLVLDAIVNDDQYWFVNGAIQAQLLTFNISLFNVKDVNGAVLLDTVRFDDLVAACAIPDYFIADSFTDSSVATQGSCYNLNQSIAQLDDPNLNVYLAGADALIAHDDVNAKLSYADAAKIADQVNHARFSKLVDPNGDYQIIMTTSGAAGIADTDATTNTGDDHVLLYLVDTVSGYGFAVGWMAVDTTGGGNWIQALVAFEINDDPNNPGTNIIKNGAYVDATAITDANFRVTVDPNATPNVLMEYEVSGQWFDFGDANNANSIVLPGSAAKQVDYINLNSTGISFALDFFSADDSGLVGDNLDSQVNIDSIEFFGAEDDPNDAFDLMRDLNYDGEVAGGMGRS